MENLTFYTYFNQSQESRPVEIQTWDVIGWKKCTKDQLISKCPYGFIVWTKLPKKLFLNFCPDFFSTFLGASWKLFGASCRLPCLWYYILSPQEAQIASRKPSGSYKKFQGRIPEIFSLVFCMKLIFHKDILKSTDL